MAARCGMSLRLGHVNDMHECGDVIFARDLGGGEVGFHEGGVIPRADGVMVVAVLYFVGRRERVTLEAFEQGADIFLDHLKLIGDGDAVAVVINGDDGGRFQHADRIDRLPEVTF